MKEELGLDHTKGRSGRGFHHPAALVMLAFGFLALEQRRTQTRQASKKDRRPPRLIMLPRNRSLLPTLLTL